MTTKLNQTNKTKFATQKLKKDIRRYKFFFIFKSNCCINQAGNSTGFK